VADSLSKRPRSFSLLEISVDWKAHLFMEYSKNQFACDLMYGKVQDDRYRVLDDVIFYKDRTYLVLEFELKKKILNATHDSPLAGHQWYFKTYGKIRERFSWMGIKDDVLSHIRGV
jgi:hypothetical protein